MIKDFAAESSQRFDADLCIVGSGLAGIALALEFERTERRVLLLESGAGIPEQDTQALYDCVVDGLPHHGVQDGRARTFGGTSTLWGGQALPLFGIDFKMRDWVPFSGWPISFDSILPYYQRAAALLQIHGQDYSSRVGHQIGISTPDFDPAALQTVFSQWSPQPNFVHAYHRRLSRSENIEVLQHANVVSIVQSAREDLVSFLRIKTLGGKTAEVRARHFVLCTGGLETPRLLLASDELDPTGVGNASGLVGRFFQDHIAVKCGSIIPTDRRAFQDVFDQSFRRGVKYLPKLVYAETAQRANKSLNAIGNVVFAASEQSALAQMRRIYGFLRRRERPQELAGTLGLLLRDSNEIARVLYRYAVQRRASSPRTGEIYLEAHLEQEPDPESRLVLDDARDALGMRRGRLSWKVGLSSWRTACLFAEAVSTEFLRLGLGRVNVPDRYPPVLPWERNPADLNHHMGTTRMSLDPSKGVVDRHCCVHGIENLHIASSSVFPTSGSSNPSLTLLALTVRLADRLKCLF